MVDSRWLCVQLIEISKGNCFNNNIEWNQDDDDEDDDEGDSNWVRWEIKMHAIEFHYTVTASSSTSDYIHV